MIYAINTIGDQNWLGPTAPYQSAATLMPMYEYLLCRDYQTGDIVQGDGQLAEDWSHNEDFSQYTFHLRKGIQFHDGWGEMTSADVKFSFELSVLEDSKKRTAKSIPTIRNAPRRFWPKPAIPICPSW